MHYRKRNGIALALIYHSEVVTSPAIGLKAAKCRSTILVWGLFNLQIDAIHTIILRDVWCPTFRNRLQTWRLSPSVFDHHRVLKSSANVMMLGVAVSSSWFCNWLRLFISILIFQQFSQFYGVHLMRSILVYFWSYMRFLYLSRSYKRTIYYKYSSFIIICIRLINFVALRDV
jgi:hypothetical protein